MGRREFRFAMREATRKGAPALFVTSQECEEGDAPPLAETSSILDRFGQWTALDLNHFNAPVAEDWAFYFGDRPVSAVALSCRATRPLDDAAFAAAAAHAAQAALPGASIELVVDAEREAFAEAALNAAGLVFERPAPFETRGPLPRTVLEAGGFPRTDLEREVACRGGARSVVVAAWKPARDVTARVAARPAPRLDGVHVLNLARRPDRWVATPRANRLVPDGGGAPGTIPRAEAPR